jgi:RNA polymerase sigma-70 factor, ECF subfamily
MGLSRTYNVVQIDEVGLFDAYFRGHAGRIYTFALRRTDAQAAQDVTAETFLVAWRRRAEMPTEPLPWLYGIARGVLANEMRAANRRGALASRIATEAHLCASTTTGDHQIMEALAVLRESDREALLLCAWEGLSTKEAATVVGCSAATFAVRLHRARVRLSRALDEIAGEADPVRSNDAVTEVPR